MKRNQAKLAFLLPAVLWVLVFTVFPLAYSAGVSFAKLDSSVEVTREKVPLLDDAGNPVLSRTGNPRTRTLVTSEAITDWSFVGGQNYSRLVKDRQTGAAIKFTLAFAVVGVTLQLTVGMAMAVLFNRKLPARTLMRTLMLLPIFATPIAVGNIFRTIFFEEGGPLSPIKLWFLDDPLKIPWLSDPSWAFASLIIVDVWQHAPFAFLVFLAGLQGIDQEQLEAAALETESKRKIFLHIVLPLMQPIIVIVLLLRIAEAFKLFDVPFLLTGGGPGIATQSYSLFTFKTGLRFFDPGYASALSYVLLLFVMLIVVLSFNRLRQHYA